MNNLGKRILSVVCALVMILSMFVLPDNPVHAATDGLNLATMQIVLPASSTAVENTAAQELKNYLYKITGTTVSIVQEGSNSGAGIYVGATEYAATKGVTYPTEGDTKGEAWAIQAADGNLVLCGAETRGTLYAVYHLLEDVFGVHWWNVWEEEVPTGDAIVPSNYADSGIPAMEYREVFIGMESGATNEFFARNRMNGTLTSVLPAYGGEESYGMPAHTHTFSRYFPARYDSSDAWLSYITTGGDFSTNPEWYSQNSEGNRIQDGQLCLTNKTLRSEFASRVIKSIEYSYNQADAAGTERPVYFAIVPNDNASFCQCSQCQLSISYYGCSGYVLSLVNEIAEAVADAGYTDVIIEMLVYWAYLDAPTKVTPASNVQIRFADNYTDILHGLDHANNADSIANLQAWAELGSNNLYYWQYVINYSTNGVMPTMFSYGDDISTLAEMGINGWFAEQEQCVNTDFWDMKQWLIAKLMEEPVSGEEYVALMDEFIYGYYGEAAGAHIRDYLYYMHEKAEATDTSVIFTDTNVVDAEWLTVQDILAGNDYFDKAFTAAGNDATLLRRLRHARLGLDRVIVENYKKWYTQADTAGLVLPFTKDEVGERVYQTLTEQIALRGQFDLDANKFYSAYQQYGAEGAPLPAEFDGIAREHILEYTADSFRLAFDGYSIVEDADSLAGIAVRADAATRIAAGDNSLILSGNRTLPFVIYDIDADESYNIGSISKSIIKANQGYQLYKMEWTVQEVGSNSYVFMTNDWGVQNVHLPSDLQDMLGQTVEIYMSMKVEGTVDGSNPDDYPVYYIDRIIVLPEADQRTHNYVQKSYGDVCRSVCTICFDALENNHTWGEGEVLKQYTDTEDGQVCYTCGVCGKTKTVTVLAHSTCLFGDYNYNSVETRTGACIYGCGKTETVDASFEHVTMYKASDIFTFAYGSTFEDQVVADSNSAVGSAVQYAAYPRRNETNNCLILSSGKTIKIATNGSPEVTYGQLKGEDLIVGQGYQLYKISIDSIQISDSASFVYIFNDWGLQSTKLAQIMKNNKGKALDIYISMKVTGNVDGKDLSADSSENWPVYWIDSVYVVTPCSYNGYDATCVAGDVQCHICSICGLTEYIQSEGTVQAEHAWDEGIVTVQPTVANEGKKVFSCAVCGVEKTETLPKLSNSEAHSIYYLASTEGCFDSGYGVKDDTEAANGKAYHMGDANLTGSQKIEITRYNETDGKLLIGTLDASQVKMNQGYQVYKFTVDVPEGLTSAGYVYFLSSWQVHCNQLAIDMVAMGGKTVDIYLSMKVTGETTSNTNIYIDRVTLVDHCEDYVDAHGYCAKCGAAIDVDTSAADELNNANSTHIVSYDDPTDESQFRSGYGVVTDEEAYGGNAYHMGDANLTGAQKINIRRYDATGGFVDIGTLDASEVRLNRGYHVYKFTVDVPAEGLTDDAYVYFLNSWQVQNVQLAKDIKAMAGKTVDIYLSMKVTGEDAANVNIYIDRVAMIDHCEDCLDAHGYCAKCGAAINVDTSAEDELNNTNSAHIISYDDPTTESQFRGGYGVVTDEEAYSGNAYHMGDANLTGAQKINIRRYDATGGFVDIGTLDASEVRLNRGYHVYKFTVDVPAEGLTDDAYVYFLNSWQVQNVQLALDMVDMAGKTVDIYLSMKVTGETTANTNIYIDRVVMVDHCEDYVGEDGNCTKCGKNIVPSPVKNWNLVLDGNIAMNFVLNLTEDQIANATVDVTVADTTKNISASKLVNENGQAVLTVELAAAQMTDGVTIALHVDGQTISKSYTVRQYADVILAGDFTNATKTLVKEMLSYGAASQTYFNYNSTNLANAGIEITPSVPTGESKMDVTGSANGVKFYGASMIHENKITVRFYFTADSIDGITFNVNGVAVTPESKNNMYYVELTDICPQDLDEAITVTVSDGTDTLTVTYAPMDYIIRMYNKANASDTTKAVVQALYGYYMAAEAYAAV